MPFVYIGIGIVIGFILGLAFFWKLGVEADEKYNEGKDRWQAGTEAYKKAARSLEICRDERQDRIKVVNAAWARMVGVLKRYLPPQAMEEIKEICEIGPPLSLEEQNEVQDIRDRVQSSQGSAAQG